MEVKLMFVHALSPLHAGTGHGVDEIDLPIAREKATRVPFLPGSALKGIFRYACDDPDIRTNVFGPDTRNAELHAGSVTFTDARLLLLPVRSLRGVFSWVTSPLLLRRLARDAENVRGLSLPSLIPALSNPIACEVSDSDSALKTHVENSDWVILEDLPLSFSESPDVTSWARWIGKALFPNNIEWQKILMERLCVVPDDVLSFLLDTATEITARIRLKEDEKTVADGALWYEESLPTETVLVSMVAATEVKATPEVVFKTVKGLSEKTLQFGGNTTVGRGLCKTTLLQEAAT